jgi:hypothetical protein
MRFPPYVHQEYPKWLHRSGAKSVLVADAEEEAAQLAKWSEAHPARVEPAANLLVGNHPPVNVPAAAAAPRKGGWPKGKPRAKVSATVN